MTERDERGGYIPRLAQANVCEAIVVAEGYFQVAVGMQGTAIEADVFLESLEDESAVVDGGFCLARHEYKLIGGR